MNFRFRELKISFLSGYKTCLYKSGALGRTIFLPSRPHHVTSRIAHWHAPNGVGGSGERHLKVFVSNSSTQTVSVSSAKKLSRKLIVGHAPLGYRFFQTGVWRRYKLGQTKQNPSDGGLWDVSLSRPRGWGLFVPVDGNTLVVTRFLDFVGDATSP